MTKALVHSARILSLGALPDGIQIQPSLSRSPTNSCTGLHIIQLIQLLSWERAPTSHSSFICHRLIRLALRTPGSPRRILVTITTGPSVCSRNLGSSMRAPCSACLESMAHPSQLNSGIAPSPSTGSRSGRPITRCSNEPLFEHDVKPSVTIVWACPGQG